MAKIPMISHARHMYGGRMFAPNDRFEVDSDDDADELRILGFASRAVVPQPSATYDTRVLVAATGAAMAASAAPAEVPRVEAPHEAEPERAKRAYNRRDVSAK